MIEFKHILAPVDFSESSARSLAHAAALARWYDATLTVLHVSPGLEVLAVKGPLNFSPLDVEAAAREHALEAMQRLLDADGIQAAPIAITGDAATTIVDEARQKGADLIVMGTHGRRGFQRLLLGSVTEGVLRRAPCPVLTVPPGAAADRAAAVAFKRILCPTDFSASALRAFQVALNLARQADGAVTLLHAIEWLAEREPRTSAHFNVPEVRRELLEEARAQLDALAAGESQTWAQIDTAVVFGRAHREILQEAETRQSDLIVMGAQGRGGLDLALFGSATQQVVRGAPCPVLTVRTRSDS